MTSSATLQALVLHKYWSGDTSARVSFFTREQGVISCLCKGGRTPKKQALLQAFTPLWLVVNMRQDRYFLSRIESITVPLALRDKALFSALYLNELVYYALKPAYADPKLFDAYWQTLQSLAATDDIEPLLRRFEWTLLTACGYGFSFSTEAQTGQAINPQAHYAFIAGAGFVQQAHGIPGSHLLALAEDDLSQAPFLQSAKRIMRQAIDQLIGGREIKARALFIV